MKYSSIKRKFSLLLVVTMLFTLLTSFNAFAAITLLPDDEKFEENHVVIGTHYFNGLPTMKQIMEASKTADSRNIFYRAGVNEDTYVLQWTDDAMGDGVILNMDGKSFTITHLNGDPIEDSAYANTGIAVKLDSQGVVVLNEKNITVPTDSTARFLKSAITSDGLGGTQKYEVLESTGSTNLVLDDAKLIDTNVLKVTSEDGTANTEYTITVKTGGGGAELTEQQKVSIAYDAVRKGTYTDLPIIEETQGLKTAAVQTKVDTLIVEAFKAKARAVSDVVATVTFDNDIYKVAIVCGDTDDNFDITNATFKLSSEAPEITTDLSEATVEYDFNATATALEIVAVSTDGGDLSYQWYKDGVAITDAMDANYTPLTTTAGTAKYYVIVTNTKDGKTATAQSKTATIVTKAQSTDVSVTGVTLDNTAIELNIGATATLTATISPENATNKNVTWSSNEEAVATVSSNGVVEALSVGTAIITVTTEDGNKTATSIVTVLEEGALAAPLITTDPANTTDIAYSTSGSSVKVTLLTSSENAKIYYTTNGDTPTADSTEYTGEFTVAQETNKAETYEVKAIAINEDTSSSVATRTISFAAEIVDEVVLSSIAVTTLPSKTEYQIGETLDITGMIVTGTYSDGSTKVETVTATDVTGFDSSTAGTKTLTVTVDGKTTTFTVTVAEIVDTKVTVTFSGIGTAGTVEAHVYKNGAEEVITVSPAKIDANSKVVFLAKPDSSSVLNTWNNNDTQKEITYTIESMITDTEVTANFIAKDITSIETAITDAKVYQTQLSDGTIIIGVSEETVEQGQQFVLQVESDALTTGIALAEKLITENDIVKIETIKQIADATTALNSITTEFKNAIKEGTKPLVTKNLKATVVSAVYGNTVAGEVYKSVYNSVSGAVYTDDEVKIQFTVKDGDGFVFGDVKVDGTSTQLPQEGNEAPTITELTGATVTILNNSWSVSIPSADLVDVENKYVVVSFTIQKDTDTRITDRMQIFIKLETDTTSK